MCVCVPILTPDIREQAEREARYSRHGTHKRVYWSRPAFDDVILQPMVTADRLLPWRVSPFSNSWSCLPIKNVAAYDGQSGSKDRGDPQVYYIAKEARCSLLNAVFRQTSNVFVANLPPHVTEQTLGNFFARAGPVGSVRALFITA